MKREITTESPPGHSDALLKADIREHDEKSDEVKQSEGRTDGEKSIKTEEDKENTEEKKKGGTNEDDEDEDLPIDKGWAWFVLAGCFLNMILLMGYFKSLSILFVEYLELFEASVTATTLFMGVSVGVLSVGAMLTMHVLVVHLGVRMTVFIGGTISSVAMVAAVFASNLTTLICVHCVLAGLGFSAIQGPGLVLLGRYFKKRRGIATSINMSGMSIAAGVFPIIARLLIDEYGIRGTMLIYTGMTMNILVGASLFRPLESFRKKRKTKEVEEEELESGSAEKLNLSAGGNLEEKDLRKANETSVPVALPNFPPSQKCLNGKTSETDKHVFGSYKDITRSTSVQGGFLKNKTLEYLRQERDEHHYFGSHKDILLSSLNQDSIPRQRTYSYGSRPHVDHITETEKMIYASTPDLIAVSLSNLANTEDMTCESDVKPDSKKTCKKCLCSILDFSLFKKPMFQLLSVCGVFGIILNIVTGYLPAYALENGIDKTKAALLLLIMGGLDFVSRLALGAIVDTKILKVNQIMGIGLIIAAIVAQFAYFYTTYPLLVMFSVFNGIFGSSYHCLVPILVVEFMGIDYMGKSLGFMYLFHGMSAAITHPILGSIKDKSGTYAFCYSYIGGMAFITALLLLIGEPIMRRRTLAMEKQDQEVKKPLKKV